MEAAKDFEASLENSLLMQSFLDPSSPTFLDRPLPDCLFSDEDTDKQAGQDMALLDDGDNNMTGTHDQAPNVKLGFAKETGEGIKLRLKLEKSESVNYVAFVNMPASKSASLAINDSLSVEQSSSNHSSGGGSSPAEPRVPPLHISLKGRNLAVLNSPKKEIKKKKTRSRHGSTDDDEIHRGKHSILRIFSLFLFIFLSIPLPGEKKGVKRKKVLPLPASDEDGENEPSDVVNHIDATQDSSNLSDSINAKPKVKTRLGHASNDDASLNSFDCEAVESSADQPQLSASGDEVLTYHLPITDSTLRIGITVAKTSEDPQSIPSEDGAPESASGVSSQEPCSLVSSCDVETKEQLSSTKLNHSFVASDKATVSSSTPPIVISLEPSPRPSSTDVVDMESTRSPHPPSLLKADKPSISSPVQSPSPLPEPSSSLLNHDRIETPVEDVAPSPPSQPASTIVKVKCKVEEALMSDKREDYFTGKSSFLLMFHILKCFFIFNTVFSLY